MTTASNLIVGFDEVGRGCWAGPLVAAAVVLGRDIPGLNDSKKLSARRRQELDRIIRQEAIAYGIGWVWPYTIDISGITTAVKLAMTAALAGIQTQYQGSARIIIDGNYNFLQDATTDWPVETLVQADGSVSSVSAASIIAKVARDNFMTAQAIVFPKYGFENHVGYGTARHITALQQLGVTPLHRMSYKPIQKFLLQSGA